MLHNWKPYFILVLSCSLTACISFGSDTVEPSVSTPPVAAQAQSYPEINEAPQVAEKAEVEAVNKPTDTRKMSELEKVTVEFEVAVFDFVADANKSLVPSKVEPEIVTLPDGNIKISYLEIDKQNIELSVSPSTNKMADYIGKIRYIESLYEGVGKTKEEIMAGPFMRTKSRRVTELARHYKGKWHY